jgi:hypothetical protein
MGSVDKEHTYELLDYFYDQGGNFIDTANNYVRIVSETIRCTSSPFFSGYALPRSHSPPHAQAVCTFS